MNEVNIKQGDILNNAELVKKFNVSNTGGLRKNNKDNCLIIIADHTKSIYDDRWIGNTFHYTGMGLVGNQKLNYMQNKTLAESKINGVTLHLFEVIEKNEYLYQGKVVLAGDPYTEEQTDKENRLRKVYVFPLKLINASEQIAIPQEKIFKIKKNKEKIIHKLSDADLLNKIKTVNSNPGIRKTTSKQFDRNPFIVEFVRRNAKGYCELCENTAPFIDKKGTPFLEVHHIEWLSEGGRDTIKNTAALCPNCHRKMHSLNLEKDKNKLKFKKC